MHGTPSGDERPQSLGEEIANSVSHGVGLLGALVAAPVLIAAPWSVVAYPASSARASSQEHWPSCT